MNQRQIEYKIPKRVTALIKKQIKLHPEFDSCRVIEIRALGSLGNDYRAKIKPKDQEFSFDVLLYFDRDFKRFGKEQFNVSTNCYINIEKKLIPVYVGLFDDMFTLNSGQMNTNLWKLYEPFMKKRNDFGPHGINRYSSMESFVINASLKKRVICYRIKTD